jgi:hypothetical protein
MPYIKSVIDQFDVILRKKAVGWTPSSDRVGAMDITTAYPFLMELFAIHLPVGDVIVQEFVQGDEVALSLMCSNGAVSVLNIDYKRAFDGDEGPNTPGFALNPVCKNPARFPM